MNITLLSADYESVEVVVSGSAVSAGDDVQLNSGVYGFYLTDGEIGDTVTVVTKASRVRAPKQAPLAIAVGEIVYYDTTGNEIDKTNTNVLVGSCVEDGASADTTIVVSWDGFAAFLKL